MSRPPYNLRNNKPSITESTQIEDEVFRPRASLSRSPPFSLDASAITHIQIPKTLLPNKERTPAQDQEIDQEIDQTIIQEKSDDTELTENSDSDESSADVIQEISDDKELTEQTAKDSENEELSDHASDQELPRIMANVTILDATATGRKATIPQFISPPTFHPCKNNATDFLNNYERTAIANGWDETLKIAYFETFLDGASNLWFQEYKQNKGNNDWDDILRDFKIEFEDTDYQGKLKQKFEDRRQSEEESVVNYLYELRVLYTNYKNTIDMEEFLNTFGKGLTEENYYNYYWLTNIPNKPPANIEELKQIAITIDKAPKQIKRNLDRTNERGDNRQRGNNFTNPRPYRQAYNQPRWSNNPPRQSYNNSRQGTNYRGQNTYNGQQNANQQTNWHRQERQAQNNPSPRGQDNTEYLGTKPRNSRNSQACYNCGKFGHFAATCRQRYKRARMVKINAPTILTKGQSNPSIPYVHITINNKTYIAIIDTGSQNNIIQEQIIKGSKVTKTNVVLVTAGGHRIPVVGETTITMKIGRNFTYTCKTKIIKNAEYPLILGMDFLTDNKAIIDLNNHTITLNGHDTLKLNKLQKNDRETRSGFSRTETPNRKRERTNREEVPGDNFKNFFKTEIAKITETEVNKRILEKEGQIADTPRETLHVFGVNRNRGAVRHLNWQIEQLYPNKENKPGEIGQCKVQTNKKTEALFLCVRNQNGDKTTLKNIYTSWTNAKNYITQKKIKNIVLPRKGWGQKVGGWKSMKKILTHIFRNTKVNILVLKDKKRIHNPLMPLNNIVTEEYQDSIKIGLLENHTLASQEVKSIELRLMEKPREESTYNCRYNIDALAKRSITIESHLSTDGSSLFIEIKASRQTNLYRGTTIAFLEEYQEEIQQPCNMINTSNEQVTMEDHDIKNIKNPNAKLVLEQLLSEYRDVFAKTPKHMGKTKLTEHRIEIERDANPVKRRPYRVSQKERETINEQIKEMLEHDIIRPCHSPWASPVVLVTKKDGSTRFCVDYKKLNNVTKKTNYPLPQIDDIMSYLGKARYFSTLDMFSGYWQVPVEEKSKPYTAFVAQGHGSYEFNVLPFGLCNGPATFQELADIVFWDMKWKEVLVYLDDVIVFSETIEGHIEKLQKVFQRMREANLTFKPSKCTYLQEEINLLGFVVNSNGIKPAEDKLRSVKDFPRPKKTKEVQSFLGLCNFYRKFIKDFSIIARPLHDATKKNNYHWGPAQEEAFLTLKENLISAPLLRHFNPDKGCTLHTDASGTGIGAVLLQENDGNLHPIAYISRSLSKSEKNYAASELELLAVVWSLGYLRHLVYGRPVKIITDHHALCWINNIKEQSRRLARWALKLAEYDYTIEYRKGTKHMDADCLSRNPVLNALSPTEEDHMNEIPTFATTRLEENPEDEIEVFALGNEKICRLQKLDKEVEEIRKTVENPDDMDIPIARRRRAKNFKIINDILYKTSNTNKGLENVLVVPKCMRGEIMWELHDSPTSGHLGLTKTLDKCKNRYYWTGMDKDIERYIKGCVDCQARKGQPYRKTPGLLQPIKVGCIFDKVGIDLLGPFRRSSEGKTMIIVATDYASRYAITAALPSGKAGPVAKFILEKIILIHGAPRQILSDRGKVFQSELVRELGHIMGVRNQFTTAYHPQCNGLTERLNKTIADMLSVYCNIEQTDWCSYVPFVTFAYNTAIQDSTRLSPFMIIFAREATLPSDAALTEGDEVTDTLQLREKALAIRATAVENLHKRQEKDKVRFDKKHRDLEFNVGDKVKIFIPVRKVGRSEKLLLKWFGPYKITGKIGEVDYEIEKKGGKKRDTVHVSRILPYFDPWTAESPVMEELLEEEENTEEEDNDHGEL